MTFEHGMQHWGLDPCKVCSIDDPGLTLTFCKARLLLALDFMETKCVD